jgi:DNA processing protein
MLDDLRWIHRDDEPAMPPLALWVLGRLALAPAFRRAAAMVGARAATPYGNHVAGELGYGLAERGWTVVSGGAYGIDAAAHRGALGGGGPTVAVLACGVDRAYPAGNASLFERIAADGALISEWPPGTVPRRVRFLVRNRVIAALSAGTIVVEAAARSGSRQTARRAAELSRALLAVPGAVTSTMSVGCHQLIRQHGATLVTNAAEIVAELGRLGEQFADPPRGPEGARDVIDAAARGVLDALPARGAASADELAREAGVDVLTALRCLTGLVAAGLVAEDRSGYRLTAAARAAPAGQDRPKLR